MSETSNFLGIVSGERSRSHAEVADRADRIASGLSQIGVGQGDCVCMLMRNDIAFVEAAYGAMRLGAYGVPINWHFKPEEINYILTDTGTSVLIGHADMLHALRDAIPHGVSAQRADAAGDPVQLQDRSRSSEDAGLRDRFRILARTTRAL